MICAAGRACTCYYRNAGKDNNQHHKHLRCGGPELKFSKPTIWQSMDAKHHSKIDYVEVNTGFRGMCCEPRVVRYNLLTCHGCRSWNGGRPIREDNIEDCSLCCYHSDPGEPFTEAC